MALTSIRSLPTGAAQSVTDSVERMRLILKGRPEWSPQASPARNQPRRFRRPEPQHNVGSAEEERQEIASGEDANLDDAVAEADAGRND